METVEIIGISFLVSLLGGVSGGLLTRAYVQDATWNTYLINIVAGDVLCGILAGTAIFFAYPKELKGTNSLMKKN